MIKIIKKRWHMTVAVAMAIVLLAGCAVKPEGITTTGSRKKGGVKTVGVALPTQLRDRWVNDGANMKRALEKLGYEVDMQYADNDTELQKAQISAMIAEKVDCIVVTPIDSAALTITMKTAENAGIPVIAYDRLLMDTDAVSYYVSFDNREIGRLIGKYVEKEKKLDTAEQEGRSYTVEFFMGSPDDNAAFHLYNGMMEVLQRHLNNGTIRCKSGKTSFADTCTLRWLSETAKQNCEAYLKEFYTMEKLDICVSAGDGLSYGLKEALEEAGYTQDNWPVITGQDAEIRAVQNIIEGYQSMSVYIDTSLPANKCVEMVQAVLEGKEPEINDSTQYHNNVKTVPAYLCTPVAVTRDNYKEILIETGYYTEEQLRLLD